MPSAYLKWQFHSGERVVACGPLVSFSTGIMGLPRRCGKIKDLSKFDAAFFGVHPKQANTMDPQLRMLLEVTYEAITDAGKKKHFEKVHAKASS